MEFAAELGLKRAARNLEAAHNAVKSLKSHLPAQLQKWVDEAHKAANEDNWSRAIHFLKKVVKQRGQKCPDKIRKELSYCLNVRAVENANKANDILEIANKSLHDKAIKGFGL